ncbi:MAG TPA: endonuclease III [Bacteroidota bacterium]|nr:endonuclease III [Bacteroidota bacterium]
MIPKRAKETIEEKQKRIKSIFTRLKKIYPDAKIALHHSNPLELLVGTILSAQCTDQRVNIVTKELFKRYKSVQEYASANKNELEQVIRSTGFYRAKAKNIINCCKTIIEKHNGKIPDTMESLVQLPGVGRKTANVILNGAFNKSEGVVVDTHVKRLSDRLGLTRQTDPEKIEQDLMTLIPKRDWIITGNLFIWHGRNICQARKPKCPDCPINDLCPSAESYMQSFKN